MLREIASTHKKNNRKFKRWFTDSDMDLFVWYKGQMPVCFQLSYDKRQQEHAVSWHVDNGFTHNLIRPKYRQAKYRIPPTRSPECGFDAMAVAREFLQASDGIDTMLADFIFSRLLEYPQRPAIHLNQAPVSGNSRWAGTAVPAAGHNGTIASTGISPAP